MTLPDVTLGVRDPELRALLEADALETAVRLREQVARRSVEMAEQFGAQLDAWLSTGWRPWTASPAPPEPAPPAHDFSDPYLVIRCDAGLCRACAGCGILQAIAHTYPPGCPRNQTKDQVRASIERAVELFAGPRR